MEMLDIVDEKGIPTGEVVERTIAHQNGVRHRTSHVWLMRKKGDQNEILLQKRSKNKDSNPGCYDISSAGHIRAGDDYIFSALRELKEELGITARAEELIFCGQRNFEAQDYFYGKLFHDVQVSNVYLFWYDKEEDFLLQTSEVESVVWMKFDECREKVKNHSIPNCIYLEELDMIQAVIKAREMEN